MNLDDATRTRLFVDMTLDFDPADATLELSIDDEWHEATWQGAAVSGSGVDGRLEWRRTARTVSVFAGPNAPAAGAVVLGVGAHRARTRVTNGSEVLVEDSTWIEVE